MLSIKIAGVIPLRPMELLVLFENGIVKRFDAKPICKDFPAFEALRDPAIFQLARVEPEGYGIAWNDELDCSEGELWTRGVETEFSVEDFTRMKKQEILR